MAEHVTMKYWIIVCLVGIVSYRTTLADGGHDWNYNSDTPEGPNHWYVNYPSCGGSMQSPINIDTPGAWYDPALDPFDFTDYDVRENVNMSLINRDGHTAEIFYKGRSLYLKGGGLPGHYELDQLHFHWGPRFQNGSEHELDWRSYPMELHIVHHKKELGNVELASTKSQGLAVYAVLFKKTPEDNPKLNQILRYVDDILESGQTVEIPTFSLKDLLPPSAASLFYRYDGGLTAPPCYESVVWTIAVDFVSVSENQINKFRQLHDSQEAPLLHTNRPVQKLNGRKVRTTVRTKYIYTGSGVVPLTGSQLLGLLCVLVYFIITTTH